MDDENAFPLQNGKAFFVWRAMLQAPWLAAALLAQEEEMEYL